jgi:hypothetical protein
LSKGNRDLHTTRSAEVPFIGGPIFCAERTKEHEFLFDERKEALLWSSAQECAELCRKALDDTSQRSAMTKAAKARIEAHRLSNDEVLSAILENL